jgi:hypothetical protein
VLPHRPAPQYTLQQLQQIRRMFGGNAPIDVDKAWADIQQQSQPMSMPYLGGELRWNPSDPAKEMYIATIKETPVKVCEAEFSYNYWTDTETLCMSLTSLMRKAGSGVWEIMKSKA